MDVSEGLRKYSDADMLPMDRSAFYKEIRRIIGHTPLHKVSKIDIPNGNTIFAKEEYLNPTGSHYDRVYYWLFRDLEEKGIIRPEVTPLIDNSSGNAAASLAWLSSWLGYSCTVVIPEDLPQARIEDIKKYGPKIVFSAPGEYVQGTNKKLREILKENRVKTEGNNGRLYCMNHSVNPVSLHAMEECAEEICRFSGIQNIDYFISAIGNGTSTTGMGRVLKDKFTCKIIGWDPEEAPVGYSQRHQDKHFEFQPHDVYGVGAWGVKFPHLDMRLLDDVVLVKKDERKEALSTLHNIERKPVGHTSAGSLAVAMKIAKEVHNKTFLVIFYDSIRKY